MYMYVCTHELSSMLQQGVSNEGVAIGTGIGEGGVPRARFGMDLGPPAEQEVDDVDVTLLGCLHQGGGCTMLNVSTCDEGIKNRM